MSAKHPSLRNTKKLDKFFCWFNFSLMEKMIDCSSILSPCMESHMSEAQLLLFAMPIDIEAWSHLKSKCQSHQFRLKRTAGKRGHSGGSRTSSTIRKTISRVANQSRVGKTLSRLTSGGHGGSRSHGGSSSSGSPLKSLLGNFWQFYEAIHQISY